MTRKLPKLPRLRSTAAPALASVPQLAAVLAVAPPLAELAVRPIRNVDYSAHYYQAVHGADHLRLAGAFWGYDP
ncbi:MAG: hypothetical protein ACREQQ_07940, partial [Candidatus Binatia bacterium]